MKTTADYIDALRVKFNVDSDFAAMSKLGVNHRQQVSKWRQLHGAFGEELSVKIADALEIDRAEVLLAMQIQKETNGEIKGLWERIAANMHYATAAAVLGVCVLLGAATLPPAISPISTASAGESVYYVKSLILLLAFVAAAFWAFPRKSPPCDSHK